MLRGLDDIPRHRERRCGQCGMPLTIDNDSGWEAFFIDKNGKEYSQAICVRCSIVQSQTSQKSPDPKERRQ